MLMEVGHPLGDGETSESRPEAVRAELDKHFFHVNPAHHFESRLWSIIRLADVPSKDLPTAEDPASVFSRFRRLLLEIPFSEDQSREDDVSREALAALEAHSLMHHVVETGLRLFVMLSELEVDRSPWIPLAELPSNFSFREKVKSLLRRADAAETAAKVAIPHYGQLVAAVGKEQALEHVRFVSQWLMFFAELFDQDGYNAAQSHNQMKHGMAAIARDDIKMTLVQDLKDPSAPTVAEPNGGYDL
jgi:hypothetical protein